MKTLITFAVLMSDTTIEIKTPLVEIQTQTESIVLPMPEKTDTLIFNGNPL